MPNLDNLAHLITLADEHNYIFTITRSPIIIDAADNYWICFLARDIVSAPIVYSSTRLDAAVNLVWEHYAASGFPDAAPALTDDPLADLEPDPIP